MLVVDRFVTFTFDRVVFGAVVQRLACDSVIWVLDWCKKKKKILCGSSRGDPMLLMDDKIQELTNLLTN